MKHDLDGGRMILLREKRPSPQSAGFFTVIMLYGFGRLDGLTHVGLSLRDDRSS